MGTTHQYKLDLTSLNSIDRMKPSLRDTTKQCTKCGEQKPFDAFHKNKKNKDGLRSRCKSCVYIAQKKHIESSYQNFLKDRLLQSEKRAKIKGFLHTITIDDLLHIWDLQRGLCSYTHSSLQHTVGHAYYNKNPYAVSIDRIDSTRGYTLDNIQLICGHVNTMKGQLTESDFFEFVHAIAKHNPL